MVMVMVTVMVMGMALVMEEPDMVVTERVMAADMEPDMAPDMMDMVAALIKLFFVMFLFQSILPRKRDDVIYNISIY